MFIASPQKMRDIKINHDYLSQRDYELLLEIEKSKEKYGISYAGKSYRFYEKNNDGTVSQEQQRKIFMEVRKDFAQWKLKRIRLIHYSNEKEKVRQLKISLDDQITTIKNEKRALFYEFKYHVKPTLDSYAQCNWKPFWKFYYDDHTTLKKLIACHNEDDLLLSIDDVTYI